MTRMRRTLGLLAIAVVSLTGSGCINFLGMGIFTPIPVQPWTAERLEDQYLHKNDHRAPLMPPTIDGYPDPTCEDKPSEREVIRAMRRVTRGVPFIFEEFRDNIRIDYERLSDYIDPPRFFPLVGPARLHHCHWKCTIYWTETIQSDYPFPTYLKKRRVEVVYIDKDHLHQYVGPDTDVQKSTTKEFLGTAIAPQ
jgi:hypothetical protein